MSHMKISLNGTIVYSHTKSTFTIDGGQCFSISCNNMLHNTEGQDSCVYSSEEKLTV